MKNFVGCVTEAILWNVLGVDVYPCDEYRWSARENMRWSCFGLCRLMLRLARCVQRRASLPSFPRLTRGIATELRPYYITTPIFYPNAGMLHFTRCFSTNSCVDPHIGHLYSLVIADVFARYRRILQPNRPVKFLAGTDEHGLKIQKAAQAKGLPPAEFCDMLSSRFRVRACFFRLVELG